jgi:ubiquinol-cytochrome c reductase iron-sulfur subunit
MQNKKRRDFIITAAASFTAAGVAISTWPLLKSLSPSADVLANATKEVNLSTISVGQSAKVMWQGKPVYVRNRSQKEIDDANNISLSEMRDPQKDQERTKPGKENWLVVLGVCTHLGCVPMSKQDGTFFCPCHGSYYDTSGRIVKGPAPRNLEVPNYYFINDNVILIGAKKEDE